MSFAPSTEATLVEQFAAALAEGGLDLPAAGCLQGFVVGSEIGLLGASPQGNTGAADLLMVTEDGRWWLVEAKLARNVECQPSFLFGNQLARYARAIETLGIQGLHPLLASYLYGRRRALRPPERLRLALEQARDLEGALLVWCAERALPDPGDEATRLVGLLEEQLSRRTLTLAALVDIPSPHHVAWIEEGRASRSLAMLTVVGGRARLAVDGTAPLPARAGGQSVTLPAFDHVPQTYKPTPHTLPRVLSDRAYELYRGILEERLRGWTAGGWPEVELSAITSAAFSVDFRSESGREICLQIGRAALAGGGSAGAHPLKLIVNLIWAAEQVHAKWSADPSAGEAAYEDLEALVVRLCGSADMLVRGIPRSIPPLSKRWRERVRDKMRGDGLRRAELVVVREVEDREGYGWPEAQPTEDWQLLTEALDAVEAWLGQPPYTCIPRRRTERAVPGMVRSPSALKRADATG